jgi:FtsX-like permease family/MacB-like periplasmic core domain
VGVVVFDSSVVQDDIDALGSATVLLSPALTHQLSSCCAYYSGAGLQVAGGARNGARVEGEVARMSALVASGVGGSSSTPARIETSAQRAIKPEAIALGVFGGFAGIAVLLIAGQVIGRILRLGAVETATLRALGADRRMALWEGLIGVLVSVVIGSLLAVGVAVVLSPLTPLGPVRPVYPTGGFAFDWTVLGLGLVALIVLLGAVAVVLASRGIAMTTVQRAPEAGAPVSRLARSAATSGLPLSAVTGLRFALESGRGRDTVPVRSAILGAVLAVAVLVTTVTFGASLDSLVSHPANYGWNWNDALLSGFAGAEDLPQHQITTLLDHDEHIKEWAGVNFVAAKVDGLHVQMITERPGAAVEPPVLSGHGLQGSDQIVLGAATLAELHKKLGDAVMLSGGHVAARRLRIVGTATMPAITKGLDMGTGAVVATSDFPVSILNPQDSQFPGPNAVLVRVAPGQSASLAHRSLEKIDQGVNAIRDAGSPAGGIVTVLRPAEIVNYRSMGTTPAILGAGLAVGAVVALGLTLVASVRRRRRELALLKSLGFTQRQLAAAIAWQSSSSVVIGAVLGVPLGIVIGRVLWNLFARDIDAVPAPSIPVLVIALIALGAVVLANIVAAVPGRMAARTPTALVLRAE